MNVMSETLYTVYLARQGETAWSISGQHTGLADLPLTERGQRHATRLGERLKGLTFAKIFTSPLQRAATTSQLAGFGATAQSDRDLVEWDYGHTRAGARARSTWSVPAGNCSATHVPAASRLLKHVREPIAW
jgi:broad specificity phosphatase PhoE